MQGFRGSPPYAKAFDIVLLPDYRHTALALGLFGHARVQGIFLDERLKMSSTLN
jgi:hypothetical protein